MVKVELIQVIKTNLTKRGTGKTEQEFVRRVTQYWSLDGELLAEVDPADKNIMIKRSIVPTKGGFFIPG